MASEHHDGFVRQRRSLILISIVLSILVWFGINGTKVRLGPGGGSGVSVDLTDTRLIFAGLYIVWAWFVVRYWQYYTVIHEQAVKSLYTAQGRRIKAIFGRTLKARAKEEALKLVEPKRSAWQCKVTSTGEKEPPVRDGWRSVSQQFSCIVSFTDDQGTPRGENQNVKPKGAITGARLYWPLLRAVSPVNIKHPYFTEYWLPLIVAALPPVLLVFRWKAVFGVAGSS